MEQSKQREKNRVSAIITTHNREPEIVCRAVRSVITQTYSDIETIVVDDSSIDYALRQAVKREVLSLNGEVQYIEHETNRGACAARNTGLSVAKGEFIAFLDDDDEWLPDKTEKQVQLMEEHPEAALVYCSSINVQDETGKEAVFNIKDVLPSYEKLIFENLIGSTSFPLIRRRCLEEIGGFDENMRSAQDYDVWLRLSRRYCFLPLKIPLVKYHDHRHGQISTDPKNKIAGLTRLIEKNREYLDRHPDAKRVRLLKVAVYYAADGQIATALKTWMRAVLLEPIKICENGRYLLRLLRNRNRKCEDVKNRPE